MEDEEYLLDDFQDSSEKKLKKKIFQCISIGLIFGIIALFLAGIIIYQVYFDLMQDKKSIHFIVFGDYGNYGRGNQKLVADRIGSWCKTHTCEFIVTTGDNFYPNGTKTVFDEHWQKSFEQVYNHETIAHIPFYAVLGNHDYKTMPQSQVDYYYFKNETRWYMPSRYYDVNVTKKYLDRILKIQFLMLDTTPMTELYDNTSKINTSELTPPGKQYEFINRTLNSSQDFDWRFIVGHHPLYVYRNYSFSQLQDIYPEYISKMNPIFNQSNIQAMFSGHAHRMMYMKDNVTKTDHFVSGAGGGTRIKDEFVHPWEQQRFVEPGFMYVTVYKRYMEVSIINDQGIVRYKHVRQND
eukprot:gene10230-2650_t